MTPKLSLSSTNSIPAKDQALVVGVVEKSKKLIPVGFKMPPEVSKVNLSALGSKSTAEHWVKVASSAGGTYLFIGLGEEYSREDLRKISGAAVRALADAKEIAFALPTNSKADVVAILEGAALSCYEFNRYKKSNKAVKLSKISCVTSEKLSGVEIAAVRSISDAVSRTKDLVNTAPNDLFPQSMAQAFVAAAKSIPGVKVTIWSEKELKANKMVGILAVGQGSSRPPRLVKIDYRPSRARKHVAFVGKGITFDSGGLSIKPPTGMLGMKYDMTGAATVGNAVLAIAAQKLNIRATAYLCIAENLPSGTATRPNDVIVYKNGKSVEITNTDAEGRLVLADGLILASAEKPDLIVDVATLTGAARIALGLRYTGLMGNDAGTAAIEAAAKRSDELVWRMPLPKELRTLINSDVADMINSKLGDPTGSMMVGGVFLNEFVGSTDAAGKKQIPWAHLDIAGTANHDGAPYGYVSKGPTGVMIRTLVEVAKALS